jgi:hypothetical protein
MSTQNSALIAEAHTVYNLRDGEAARIGGDDGVLWRQLIELGDNFALQFELLRHALG